MKLMQKYREAPEWWFLAVFAISFAFGLAASVSWDTHLPWWAYIISLLIGSVLALPVGIIQAITNQQTGLNVITEMIYGYMQPGRPVATMMFKSYGYMMCSNSLSYIADMKIGHYMKISPRAMFRAQLYAVVWLSIVQVATYNFLRNNIEGICTRNQTQGLTCPNAKTYYNASVIWGVLGPARMFGAGSIYSWTNYFWLIGAALPTIQYFLARRYPRSIFRYIFFPTIFGVAGMIPPATAWYIGQWIIVGFIFNVWIRSRYFGWWSTLPPLFVVPILDVSSNATTQSNISTYSLVRWTSVPPWSLPSLLSPSELVARISQTGGATLCSLIILILRTQP